MGNTCYNLVGDILLHYWYSALQKNNGFVMNEKHEQLVINVVLKAQMIPNSCVTLPTTNFRDGLCYTQKHPHKRYWVHNLESKWASRDCSCGQCGNICKHQVKVLQLLHSELVAGTIAHYCGALKGNVEGGLQHLFNP